MNKIDVNSIDTYRNIIELLNIGVVILDEANRIVAWNRFMAEHSGIEAGNIIGRDLFALFPYLPRQWMEMKFRSVRLIKNYSFVSWTRRSYLFRFNNKSMVLNADLEYMYQDCTFIPVKDISTGQTYVCITITDMTEVAASRFELEEIKDINITLEQMTNIDGLTSLHNKAFMEKQVALEFTKAKQDDSMFSIVFFDIDKFKRVNDTYGHIAGDEVLKMVSSLIDRRRRDSDVCARYGGEEFLLLLPETDEQQALLRSEHLRKIVEQAVTFFEDKEIKVTISLGVVEFRKEMKTHLQMIHEADIALYHSKSNGRNAVSLYKDDQSELFLNIT